MSQTKGAIIVDGWTCGTTHYVAVVPSYCSKEFGRTVVHPRLSCIPVAPLGKVSEDGDVEKESRHFDAETHLEFIEEVFQFYNLNLFEWVVCLICDNASINRHLARISSKPSVRFCSHKLNLEVNSMFSKDVTLKDTLSSVSATMKSARHLKNAAILRNLTDLKAVLANETRWSGKYSMIQRFIRIYDQLCDVSNDAEGDLTINRAPEFLNQAQRFATMLGEIAVVTKSLQTSG